MLVNDACGSKTLDAHEKTMAALKETGEVLAVSTAEVLAAMKNMGMNKARVESFSDGVFAFAITLRVLGMQVPDLKSIDDRQLRERLLQALQQLLPYVTSFATIGIIWLNHRAMFDEVESVEHPVLVINLLLLFVISFIPFPTAVLSRYGALPSNTFLYGSVLTMLAMTFSPLHFYIAKRGFRRKEMLNDRSRWNWRRNLVGLVTYPGATVISLPHPRAGVTIYFLLAGFYLLPSRSLWASGES